MSNPSNGPAAEFLNNVEIAGRIERVTVRKTAKGQDWATFRVCWEGSKDRLWLDCKWFSDKAKNLIEGSVYEVRGRLITESWDDKLTGKKVYKAACVVRGATPMRRVEEAFQQATGVDDDIPF